MYDLESFGLKEMIESAKEVRDVAYGAASMEDGARHVVDLLYDRFQTSATGEPSCALVRCFKTHPLSSLPPDLARLAHAAQADPHPPPAMRCLTLLATRGMRPQWNSRQASEGHRVIPLPTRTMVEQAPMIARLIVQMGLEIEQVVNPDPGLLLDLETRSFNVFHIEDATGSPYVPAQQTFVLPYAVRSVLGFGGLLPGGDIFAVVMFTRVRVTRETAALFRTFALSVKLALLPFAGRRIFNK